VQVLNAGQTPPLVWRAGTKSIETIRGTAPALGMVDDFEYVEGPRLTLADGDILIAFTDGFVEARSATDSEQLFDEAGVRRVLEASAASGKSARELTEALVESALQFSGGLSEDDMTVVTVRKVAESA